MQHEQRWDCTKHKLHAFQTFQNKRTKKSIVKTSTSLTCDAKEKLGPGDLFLFGAGGALFAAPPEFDPLRFRLLLAGRWDSEIALRFW